MEENPKLSEKSSKNAKKSLPVARLLTGLVFITLVALCGYLYKELQDVKNNPEKVSQQQVESLVEKVGKLITLPSDEEPTIATVQDKEKLADQPFFADAQNGDKLLIYANSQKAIIYRESTNSLVNVGPVTLDTASSGVTEDGTQDESQ